MVEKVFTYAVAVPFILPAGTDARRFTDLSDAFYKELIRNYKAERADA